MKRLFVVLLVAMTGCQTTSTTISPNSPAPAHVPDTTVGPEELKPNFAMNQNRVDKKNGGARAGALLNQAREQLKLRKPDAALGILERALKVEPRNPYVWHEMARAHLILKHYEQTRAMAQKSNGFAGDDSQLKEMNSALIEAARR